MNLKYPLHAELKELPQEIKDFQEKMTELEKPIIKWARKNPELWKKQVEEFNKKLYDERPR
jgi:hypothetical protein